MMPTQKNVKYDDKTFKIVGLQADSYFANIKHNIITNRLLAAILTHHVAPGSTVIDVGANVGLTSLLAATFVQDSTIISIEPSNVFPYLQETMELNQVRNQNSLQCCIGSTDGKIAFNNSIGNSSASHIGGTDLMVLRSLDSIARELSLSRCDFVKVDVEGFETGVLDGMNNINSTFKPLIFMEFNAYCLTALAEISPLDFLRRIVRDFGCFLANTVGTDLEIVGADGIIPFLNRHMAVRGCVEDIVFSADPARIAAFQL